MKELKANKRNVTGCINLMEGKTDEYPDHIRTSLIWEGKYDKDGKKFPLCGYSCHFKLLRLN
jgi:hypothetical protein